MEVEGGSERKGTVVLCEMFGTALFIYGILVSRGDAIAVPLSLFASILIFGNITGGHFNPAVSFGVLISNGRTKTKSNFVFFILIVLG